MKKWKSKLFPVITLAVCLGLAACGGGAESEGSSDDQEDYEETENSAPESFEGMVKDPDITAVYDMYWGTWIGEDDNISSWLSSTSPKRTKIPLVTTLLQTSY